MNIKIEAFVQELRAKLDGIDKRMKGLDASTKGATAKAQDEAKVQLAMLESRVRGHRAKVQSAEAKTKAWLDEKRAATAEKIAAWRAKHDAKTLTFYANSAEDYAMATMQVVALAIDEAERAAVQAVVARMDADAAQMAPAKGA